MVYKYLTEVIEHSENYCRLNKNTDFIHMSNEIILQFFFKSDSDRGMLVIKTQAVKAHLDSNR